MAPDASLRTIACLTTTVPSEDEAQALARGLDISCGCFGSGSGKVNYISILRNTLLLLMSVWVVFDEARKRFDKAHSTP